MANRQQDEQPLLKLEDLPESCLAMILRFTSPRDVCRLSVLSSALKSACNSDFVWECMLPSHYHQLLQKADQRLEFSSKKELYFKLCNPISFDNGTKKFWLDQATSQLCLILSAKDLSITWGDDDRYWRWISRNDSSFTELASLYAVCWLEVRGQFDSKILLPGTTYTVSFKLKFRGQNENRRPFALRRPGRMIGFQRNEGPYGWNSRPVVFEITTGGHHQVSARFLKNMERSVDEFGYRMTSFRQLGDGWMEFDAGEFVVEQNEDSPKEVTFCMREWDGGNWKGGLFLEGVKIQPSFLLTKRNQS